VSVSLALEDRDGRAFHNVAKLGAEVELRLARTMLLAVREDGVTPRRADPVRGRGEDGGPDDAHETTRREEPARAGLL
jgi:hypothetical protein